MRLFFHHKSITAIRRHGVLRVPSGTPTLPPELIVAAIFPMVVCLTRWPPIAKQLVWLCPAELQSVRNAYDRNQILGCVPSSDHARLHYRARRAFRALRPTAALSSRLRSASLSPTNHLGPPKKLPKFLPSIPFA